MENIKIYLSKITFIFKEIFKAEPFMLLSSLGAMFINGFSPVITAYTTSSIIEIFEQNIGNFTQDIYNHLLFLLI
jgi:hypothetical protein